MENLGELSEMDKLLACVPNGLPKLSNQIDPSQIEILKY